MQIHPWLAVGLLCVTTAGRAASAIPVRVGAFPQEVREEFTEEHGLPSGDVRRVAIADDGRVWAGTEKGLARWDGKQWRREEAAGDAAIEELALAGTEVWYVAAGMLRRLDGSKSVQVASLPSGVLPHDLRVGTRTLLATDQGLWVLEGSTWRLVESLSAQLGADKAVYEIAAGRQTVVGAAAGLFEEVSPGEWRRLMPSDGAGRSWAAMEVRGVAYDEAGQLWFASPQGVGRRSGGWTLWTGAEGLPWNQFTGMAAGAGGIVWFGTTKGAIRFEAGDFRYRQGRRWLPDDRVQSLAAGKQGEVWLATKSGLSRIRQESMTLADKANYYEHQIDALHRRTPWEYVLEVSVAVPGRTNVISQQDSDNDGLWTSMYGAGECFAYGATKSPKAQARARKAFEALRWLGEVTQGGPHAPPPGYVARTILPASGPDPNAGRLEQDRAQRERGDRLWKVYEPRWPKSRDGKWYWKSDTSSDELDGHFFFYPLYYDLAAETPEEKRRVQEHCRALIDHLVNHDFKLVDHDGKVTRWGMFDPQVINRDPMWTDERGLNSLSMLSYLAAAAHVTGDSKYEVLMERLCEREYYDANLRVPKLQRGIGSVNHSDDEMAFMCFYNLMKYAKNEKLKQQAGYAWFTYWTLEFPEMNPFFNFAYAAFGRGFKYDNPWGTHDLTPWAGWLEDSVETLQRFPLDRFSWRHDNRHRLDLVRLPRQVADPYDPEPPVTGHRFNGKAFPVDERFFEHWNHNPFQLQTGGRGDSLADGVVFLLPYYMGLYHGLIEDEAIGRLGL